MPVRFPAACPVLLVLIAALTPASPVAAQTRLDDLSDYNRYRAIHALAPQFGRDARVRIEGWDLDRSRLVFQRDGTVYEVLLESGEIRETDDTDGLQRDEPTSRRPRAPRGRQLTREDSPDGRWQAVSDDYNVRIEPIGTAFGTINVTTDGERKYRYGQASWVYGEELKQNTAMWWSPDSRRLAFYEFDEREVRDYYLTGGLTDLHTTLLVEGYPKAGEANPIAKLRIVEVASRETIQVDVGEETEQYIYNVQFCPNGDWLLFHRTNRHQNHLEVMAADPETGASRVILEERQETWQDNSPTMRFLDDGQHFIWQTEKTGWAQYELHHIETGFVRTLTEGDFPVEGIERVDEARGVLYYIANSSATPLNRQLHRVNLDGSNQMRLTHEDLNHAIQLSPDGRYFIATMEATDTPPRTVLYDDQGNEIAVLAESDPTAMLAEHNITPAELFSFTADDGETTLYGMLYKPTNFDPDKTYPLLVDVYGGPAVRRIRNTYRPVNPNCEFGLIIATMENRGTPGRGKAFEGATYLQLGIVDIQDQVDGVKYLTQRPYIDADRVGIYGHSYGGYMAALGILKFPDVFHVAVAGAPVTDWRNYDTIYTERYMRTPQENPEGYHDGSCLTYADQLRGHLLIMHGMVDDNVHPSNVWQLVDRLQRARLPHDVMFYPNGGHGLGPGARGARLRYLVQHLITDDQSGREADGDDAPDADEDDGDGDDAG